MTRAALALAVVVALALAALWASQRDPSPAPGSGSGAGAPTATFERRQVLEGVTKTVVLPTLARFVRAADALAEDPTPERWRAARVCWKRVEAFSFGPAGDLHIVAVLDFHPPRPASIARYLEAVDPKDEHTLESAGAAARGFPPLEYMLFGPGARRTDARAAKYRAALAADIAVWARRLQQAWLGEPNMPGFAAELTSAGQPGNYFESAQRAIDRLVYQLITTLERVAADRLGRPLGKRAGGAVQPDQVESRWSGHSLNDLLATLDGLESVYRSARIADGALEGDDAIGLDDLARHLDPAMADRIAAEFAQLRAALRAIPGRLDAALADHRPAVEQAFEATRRLHRAIATDLVGKLGVQFEFNDNDGD